MAEGRKVRKAKVYHAKYKGYTITSEASRGVDSGGAFYIVSYRINGMGRYPTVTAAKKAVDKLTKKRR